MPTVLLPGGVRIDGALERCVSLRDLVGEVELMLGDPGGLTRPEWVTRVLCAAIDRVGASAADRELVERLAVGDRVFLMIQLGIQCAGDAVWLSSRCPGCAQIFDVCVRPLELETYRPERPDEEVPLSMGTREVLLRGPNGADQSWLALRHHDDPAAALLSRCVRCVDGEELEPDCFAATDPAWGEAIEAAFRRVAPAVECTLRAQCPSCGGLTSFQFDPYWFCSAIEDALDADVHALAVHYHWAPGHILALSRRRRRRYVGLIDRARGVHA